MDEDKVYLVWKDVNTGKKFKVGMLYKEDDMFYFRYVLENLKEAEEHGFHLLIPFPNFNAIYFCPHLFANFASRLPDKSRPEIDKILKEYGMTEYDEFELLKRSGAKLPTDGYGFVSMKSIDFDSIEMKHNKLISEAKKYMSTIKDYEHDINHMYDVVNYTKELLSNMTGVDVSLVRPPYGEINNRIKRRYDVPYILWSNDTKDWKLKDANKIYEKVINEVSDGDIILMHETYLPSVTALDMIIPKLQEMGYQIVTVSELANLNNAKLENGVVYHSFK